MMKPRNMPCASCRTFAHMFDFFNGTCLIIIVNRPLSGSLPRPKRPWTSFAALTLPPFCSSARQRFRQPRIRRRASARVARYVRRRVASICCELCLDACGVAVAAPSVALGVVDAIPIEAQTPQPLHSIRVACPQRELVFQKNL